MAYIDKITVGGTTYDVKAQNAIPSAGGTVSGNILPGINHSGSLGSTTNKWAGAYVDYEYIGDYIHLDNIEIHADDSSGTEEMWLDNAEDVYVNGGYGTVHVTNWDDTSDRNLKDEIGEIRLTSEQLRSIPLVRFKFKDRPGREYVGTYAQDVQKVLPQVVNTNMKDGQEILGMNYASFATAVGLSLVKIDEEREEEISALEEENKNLEARIEALENALKNNGKSE